MEANETIVGFFGTEGKFVFTGQSAPSRSIYSEVSNAFVTTLLDNYYITRIFILFAENIVLLS